MTSLKLPINSAKRLIMLILFLLVGLFMAGMGVLSSLNLSYSEESLSALRLAQIEETFYAGLHRIDARHKLMERNLNALARLGELFYRLARDRRPLAEDTAEAALREKIEDFPEAFGGGLWFDPGAYPEQKGYFGLYAHWQGQKVTLRRFADDSYDYFRQSWYQAALPPGWNRAQARPEPFYWTPAYYHPLLQTAVITLAGFLYDPDGRIVGLATTDWKADEIVQSISGSKVTPGSFAFILDAQERKLSSLSQEESLRAQSLLAAITLNGLEKTDWTPQSWDDGAPVWGMKRKQLEVQSRVYHLFFSKTRAGMIFGISVPHEEIYAVLAPMRAVNYRVGLIVGSVVLLLSLLILYIVAGIMRLLETLYRDSLTGLPSRFKLLQDLKHLPEASLILMNLDSFKEINDFYGHKCGDHLLRSLAQRLHESTAARAHQPAPVLYKLPADEFAVLFSAALDQAQLEHWLRAFSAFFQEQTVYWEEQEIGVSATQGAAISLPGNGGGETPEEALPAQANMALKFARKQKKHWLIYDESLQVREEYRQNLLWAKKIKAAVQQDRIVPYFQPILDNRSGRIVKFECLMRLIDEQGKPVPPTAGFLPVAKKLRLYRELTRTMVEKSCAVFREQSCQFSLNLSYEDLRDPDTLVFIEQRFTETGIAERAVFEILESESIENYYQVHTVIERLKRLGSKISIDDFGTGYSNFEHILRLNVDLIKIDGSLIRNLDRDAHAQIVTESIVQFARRLHLRTVAEFVHNQAVQEKVIELGIDYSQGYYIGPPAAQPYFTPLFRES